MRNVGIGLISTISTVGLSIAATVRLIPFGTTTSGTSPSKIIRRSHRYRLVNSLQRLKTPKSDWLSSGCAWGLRRSELASLHARNIELQVDSPHLTFETRKNGPGTVALIYGQTALEDQVTRLSDRDDWNGYLFSSSDTRRDHVTGETINRRFKTIAARADVRVQGNLPTSKMGRRFWYSTYADAVETIIDRLQSVAHEQGVVIQWWCFRTTSRKKRRGYLRDAMRDRLEKAFEDKVGQEFSGTTDSR
ncbi:hypothetical protein D8S78_24150 [Natrialba swarupiae]|nr:hypothetical protein [Natrialba swarupiae]